MPSGSRDVVIPPLGIQPALPLTVGTLLKITVGGSIETAKASDSVYREAAIDRIVVGAGALGTADRCTVIGAGASGAADGCTVIGETAAAFAGTIQGVAIGRGANVQDAAGQVAIGHAATARNQIGAVAIGRQTFALNDGSIAIGYFAYAGNGYASLALGRGARVEDTSDRSIAIGEGAQSQGIHNILIGSQTRVPVGGNGRQVVIGSSAIGGGTSNVIIGELATGASIWRGIAIGYRATLTGHNQLIIGDNAADVSNDGGIQTVRIWKGNLLGKLFDYVAGTGLDLGDALESYRIAGTQVVAARGAAVADAAGGATVDAEARAAINTLLARARVHGLIA